MQMNEMIRQYQNRLRHENILAVFDRDGTLAPIVDDPDRAVLSEDARETLLALADCPNVQVAILSARCLRQLMVDFGKSKIVLAGNYGLEIAYPDGEIFQHPVALSFKQQVSEIKEFLKKALKAIDNAMVDDHDLSLCIHFHLVPEAQLDYFHGVIKQAEQLFPDLHFNQRPTSYEVMPPIGWDKGSALDKLALWGGTISPERNKNGWLYLYAGDSEPDQAAFAAVNKRKGISIQIGQYEGTRAIYELGSPADLISFLKQLIEERKILK